MLVLDECRFPQADPFKALSQLSPLPKHLSIVNPRGEGGLLPAPRWEDFSAFAICTDSPFASLSYGGWDLGDVPPDSVIQVVNKTRSMLGKTIFTVAVESEEPYSDGLYWPL